MIQVPLKPATQLTHEELLQKYETTDRAAGFFLIGVIVFGIALFIVVICWRADHDSLQYKAIKGGAAYYDPQTGELKWRHEQPVESWPAKPLEPAEKSAMVDPSRPLQGFRNYLRNSSH